MGSSTKRRTAHGAHDRRHEPRRTRRWSPSGWGESTDPHPTRARTRGPHAKRSQSQRLLAACRRPASLGTMGARRISRRCYKRCIKYALTRARLPEVSREVSGAQLCSMLRAHGIGSMATKMWYGTGHGGRPVYVVWQVQGRRPAKATQCRTARTYTVVDTAVAPDLLVLWL